MAKQRNGKTSIWAVLETLLLLVSGVMTLTAFWGRYHWLFNLTSYFRLQYSWLQGVVAVTALLGGRVSKAMMALSFLSINLSRMAPYFIPHPHRKEALSKVICRIRILQLNVLATNRNFQAVARHVDEVDPDILALEEFTEVWHDEIKKTGVLDRYSYQRYVVSPNDKKSGRALFSRYPIDEKGVKTLDQTKSRAIISEITVQGHPVTLILMHPEAALGPVEFIQQEDDWDDISDLRHMFNKYIIIVGDLNITPWTFPFERFTKKLAVHDSQKGMGLQPSYPTRFRVPMIPIDHCLTTGNFIVLDRRIGPHVGSDHYPVYIELGMLPEGEGLREVDRVEDAYEDERPTRRVKHGKSLQSSVRS